MITPWEIYWVLQLDSISVFLTIIFDCMIVAAFGTLFIGALITDRGWCPSNKQDAQWASVKKLSLRLFIACVVPGLITAFIPSTKTAAAMVVVPQIINSPTIQHEAGDLYKLAKEALQQAIAPEHKK